MPVTGEEDARRGLQWAGSIRGLWGPEICVPTLTQLLIQALVKSPRFQTKQ